VQRPHRDYHGPQGTQVAYYGQQPHPQYTSRGVVPIDRGYALSSIEASTPSTAYSSPRMSYHEIACETSSISSSSRESSAHPRGPIPSATTAKPRTNRMKRGSESQGSGHDHRAKRPSHSPQSDRDNGQTWCLECECCTTECSDPKIHAQRLKKIVKEKSARSAQAAILQKLEDLTQIALNFNVNKRQQPGNKKKSGLTVDKKQGLSTVEIIVDEALQTIAKYGPQEYLAFEHRVRCRTEAYLLSDSPSELPAGSLLAGPSGEDSCQHVGSRCEPIECRKDRRSRRCKDNLHHLWGSSSNTTSRGVSSGSKSKSSTPRRH
jgi:hypothetical protein